MEAQNSLMARPRKQDGSDKPKKAKPDESYRKAFKTARIPRKLAEVATNRAEELMMDFTEYVKGAVRMRLEAEGKWPPKD